MKINVICTVYVLIIEFHRIAGVINILLDVTFIMCCNVDLCMHMY